MKVEIEFPNVIKDQFGKSYEPTGEWREVRKGEYYLWDKATAELCITDHQNGDYLILKPTWTWPEWLSGWGFALDIDGNFYWYENEPVKSDKYWNPENETKGIRITDNTRLMLPSFPPLPTDWKKPILNPNYVNPNKEDDGTEHDPE